MRFESLDIVTTATIRPDVLDLTLRSFYLGLVSQVPKSRLIINIDPVPVISISKIQAVIGVAQRYFPDLLINTPPFPSFPLAVKWGWEHVESEFFLHLEDDWFLRKRVDVEKIRSYFGNPSIAAVTLNPQVNTGVAPGLALRPSIFRREFITRALPYFCETLDPEKQWRRHLLPDGKLHGWSFRHYGEVGEGRFIFDLGAKWRRARTLRKWNAGEVTWERAASSGFGLLTGLAHTGTLWLGHRLLDFAYEKSK